MSRRSRVTARLTFIGGILTSLTLADLAEAQPVPDAPDAPVAPPSAPAAAPLPPVDAPASKPSVVIVVEPSAPAPAPAAPPPIARPVASPPSPWVAAEPLPAPPYEDKELDTPNPQRGHVMFRAGVGPSIQSFHSDRVISGGLDLTLGADTKHVSAGGNLGLSFGRTEPGLHTWSFHLGADIEFPIGPVRLGFSPRFGSFAISRLTEDSSFVYGTVGVAGVVGVDLFRSDGFALALDVRPSIDYAANFALFGEGDAAAILGGTALLDFRFRGAKGPPKPRKTKVHF